MPDRFGGKVDAGKLLLDDPVRWTSALARLASKRVFLTLEPERIQRSTQQNRWYWGMVVPLVADYLSHGRELPISNDQAHYVLKSAFLGVDDTPLGPVPKSTKALTVEEFSLYCDKIVSHAAAEWGLNIPAPGDRIEASL